VTSLTLYGCVGVLLFLLLFKIDCNLPITLQWKILLLLLLLLLFALVVLTAN